MYCEEPCAKDFEYQDGNVDNATDVIETIPGNKYSNTTTYGLKIFEDNDMCAQKCKDEQKCDSYEYHHSTIGEHQCRLTKKEGLNHNLTTGYFHCRRTGIQKFQIS